MSGTYDLRFHYATPSSPLSDQSSLSYGTTVGTADTSVDSFEANDTDNEGLLFADDGSVFGSLPSSISNTDYGTFESSLGESIPHRLGVRINSATDDPATVAKQIIKVHHDWTIAINNRAWSDLVESACFYHPSYRLECRFTLRFLSYVDTISALQELCKSHPDFVANVVEASATVDPDSRSVHVFFHTEWVGAPTGLTTQVVHIVEWKWVDGMWLCFKANLLRGVTEAA